VNLSENIRIALASLRANWFRAVLTALGVVIGVAALIAVTAVSAGAQKEVADSIRRLGGNVIKVDGEFIAIGTRQSATDRTITPADVAAVAALPAVVAVAPHQSIESLTVASGRNQANTFLEGVTADFARIQNQQAVQGRLLSDTDIAFGRNVALIGLDLAARLFPGEPALGRTIRVGSREFEVVGVQNRRGRLADENLDNRIFIPLPVLTRAILGGGPNTVHLDVLVQGESDIEPTITAIEDTLSEGHNLPEGYPDDFSAEDQASIVKEAQRATSTFRILTFSLGGIALLVGGIGIMNMMLVSVRERTREIGIRKSVGAGPGTVQGQFLIEALVLSTLGGLVGIVAGLVATGSISSLAGWETLVGPLSVVFAFSTSVAVGLFFGFFPARRAARLDPISALRYE
jgi:putative ABC transport system permease protein